MVTPGRAPTCIVMCSCWAEALLHKSLPCVAERGGMSDKASGDWGVVVCKLPTASRALADVCESWLDTSPSVHISTSDDVKYDVRW